MNRKQMKLKESFLNSSKIFQIKEISFKSIDKKFFALVIVVIESNMTSSNFNISNMCYQLFFSRTNLHRKLISITSMINIEFIKII